MHRTDAATLARGLMDEHGLRNWTFAFNRRKRNLGLCRYDARRIELSCHYVDANDEASVRDTILHEIAHALAGHRAGHGPLWKRKCLELGATPKRCDDQAAMPDGCWSAQCPACARRFTRHRRPMRNRRYACGQCGPQRGALVFRRATIPAGLFA